MIRLYRINTGSCGGCDIEIGMAVATSSDLAWAASPYEADALLLTGPITRSSRTTLLALLQEVRELPLLAIGRCAIDGHPFGRGGVQAVPDITTRLQLDGCPPEPHIIANAIRDVLGYQPLQAEEEAADATPQEFAPLPDAAPDAAPQAAPQADTAPDATPQADAAPDATPQADLEPGELVDEEEDPASRRARLLQRIKPLRRQAGETPAAEPPSDPEAADAPPAAADEAADKAPGEGQQAAPDTPQPRRKKRRRRSPES